MTPCTCKVVVKRDPVTFNSSTRIHVNQECPHHGLKPTEGTSND